MNKRSKSRRVSAPGLQTSCRPGAPTGRRPCRLGALTQGYLWAAAFAVVMAGLWCQAESPGQVNDRGNPPPFGARLVSELRSVQDIYTNYPSAMWCPACVTSSPPCRLACYMVDMTAIGRFTFEVSNKHPLPRTFHFNDGQQCELELCDQSGAVVAAWSDGKRFTPALTSLTIQPGQTVSFTLEIPLKDREGKQLNGTYLALAYLLTGSTGPQSYARAVAQIIVTSSRTGE